MQLHGMGNWLDTLTGKSTAAATATALDTAAARPFSVALSIEKETRGWLLVLAVTLIGGVMVTQYLKK